VCLIIMARDEAIFLTHWIWHYSRLLERPKFIVIDDASDPAMVAGLRAEFPQADLDVIRLPEGPFLEQYKSNALSAMATIAVDRFAVVIATDANEIVMPIGPDRDRQLVDLLHEAPGPFVAPIGVAPIQDLTCEPAFDPRRPVGDQRSVGQLRSASCKPCIWKGESWLFSPGQHGLRQRRVPIFDRLALVHLKYVDAEVLAGRQAVRRARSFSAAQGDDVARHWRPSPEAMRKMPLFAEAPGYRDAPPLTAAIPDYLNESFDRWNDGFVIRDLRQIRPVSLTGEL
jgi:hypothetical protein